MIDDPLSLLSLGIWLMAAVMWPVGMGFLFGVCSACCQEECPCSAITPSKPCTDPADEGTWVPSGDYPDLTWTYDPDLKQPDAGGSWFFFGSASSSKVGGSATQEEQQDWGNLCNWYSVKNNTPPFRTSLPVDFPARATRLPPTNATVFIYTPVSTVLSGPVTVKAAYFYFSSLVAGSDITTTDTAYVGNAESASFGSVVYLDDVFLTDATLSGGALFLRQSSIGSGATVNGGAEFNFRTNESTARGNFGTINGGAIFKNSNFSATPRNRPGAVINGGAQFFGQCLNEGTVNDGAVFSHVGAPAFTTATPRNSTGAIVNGGAEFILDARNDGEVNDGAVFDGTSRNFFGTVNGGGVFDDDASNAAGTVNGGGVFNDNAKNTSSTSSTVNGGAEFKDAACSERSRTVGGVRFFVAHPTDFPTCSGTAPPGSNAAATCGCN
jgi:hypothetical protein